jgi:hypothetical protein
VIVQQERQFLEDFSNTTKVLINNASNRVGEAHPSKVPLTTNLHLFMNSFAPSARKRDIQKTFVIKRMDFLKVLSLKIRNIQKNQLT